MKNESRRLDAELAAEGVSYLVTKTSAARLLQVHPRTIERFIAQGRLLALRTTPGGSGRSLIPRSSLARFLATLLGSE